MPGLTIKALGGVRAFGGGGANQQAAPGPTVAQVALAPSTASTDGGDTSLTSGGLTPAKIHKWLFIGSVGFLGFLYWSLPN